MIAPNPAVLRQTTSSESNPSENQKERFEKLLQFFFTTAKFKMAALAQYNIAKLKRLNCKSNILSL